jgi:hypothetical protein
MDDGVNEVVRYDRKDRQEKRKKVTGKMEKKEQRLTLPLIGRLTSVYLYYVSALQWDKSSRS